MGNGWELGGFYGGVGRAKPAQHPHFLPHHGDSHGGNIMGLLLRPLRLSVQTTIQARLR